MATTIRTRLTALIMAILLAVVIGAFGVNAALASPDKVNSNDKSSLSKDKDSGRKDLSRDNSGSDRHDRYGEDRKDRDSGRKDLSRDKSGHDRHDRYGDDSRDRGED